MPDTQPVVVTHAPPRRAELEPDSCPWCGQPITHQKFREIEDRIKAEERQKLACLEAKLQEHFDHEKAADAAKADAEIQRLREAGATALEQERKTAAEREAAVHAEAKKAALAELNEQLTKAEEQKQAAEEAKEAAERDKLEALSLEREKAAKNHQELEGRITQLRQEKEQAAAAIEEEKKAAAEREEAVRTEAKKAALVELNEQLTNAAREKQAAEEAQEAAEREKVEALSLEREKAAKNHQELESRIMLLQREKEQAAAVIEEERKKNAEREAVARAEATKAAEHLAQTEQEELRHHYQEEIHKQREALEKDKEATLNQEKAKAFSDRQKLEIKIEELKRQVQAQSAIELGEGAELDLFESLRAEFQHDRINRIEKGEPGADIRHEVLHLGEFCGRIVYDSKNRKAWRNDYVRKLRADQLAAEADHALLTTSVFPAGEYQICIRDGVIVANPARAVVLVRLLREHILQAHRLRLSGEDRESKTAELYDFMNSDRCEQLLRRTEDLTSELLDLDVKEKEAHERTWQKRGLLVRSAEKAQREFRSEVGRIVGA